MAEDSSLVREKNSLSKLIKLNIDNNNVFLSIYLFTITKRLQESFLFKLLFETLARKRIIFSFLVSPA